MKRNRSSFRISGWCFQFIVYPGLMFFLSGCALRVGPKIVAHDRFDYSSAIAMSWKEQMLMNMVRRRYLDPPFFMDVAQVVASYTFGGTAQINTPSWAGDVSGPAAGVEGHWTESPTITYSPLVGDLFIKSMLKPLSPTSLFFLVQSGWPIDVVLAVAARSVNGLQAGSTMEMFKHSSDPAFYQVLKALRELQQSNSIALRVLEKDEGTSLVFRPRDPSEEMRAKGLEVRKMLGLDATTQEFRLVLGAVSTSDKEIAILTRSMLEIMAEASAGIEIPETDVQEGRATKQVPLADAMMLIRVHSADRKPPANNVFATIKYHEHWFWVDDRDLSS